jgi:hypothetical protein
VPSSFSIHVHVKNKVVSTLQASKVSEEVIASDREVRDEYGNLSNWFLELQSGALEWKCYV